MAEIQFNTQTRDKIHDQTPAIDLHDIIHMVIANWYWFILSILVCVGAAYYYLAKTPKIYTRSATILIKDSRKGGDVELSAFSDLSGYQSRKSIDNELFILQSRKLMTEVVRRLNLTVNYTVDGRFQDRDLYGQSPVEVVFVNDSDNQSLSLEVTPVDDQSVRLTKFHDPFISKQESEDVITARFGDTVASPIGQIIVRKTLYMDPSYRETPIRVSKGDLKTIANMYRGAVKCEVTNQQASVVTLSMNNAIPKRAEDVLNTLIEVYEQDAINDKRRVSISTAEFIKSRLEVIGRELGEVDRDIENLKKDNRMVDISSEATRSLTESSQYKAEGLSLDNQINIAEFVRGYLADPAKSGELIPAMAAISNGAVTAQIDEYNATILQREKLLENSSPNNPVIRNLDNLLASIRRAIIASLDSHIATLEIQRNAMRNEEESANRRISTMPSQEKIILGITRQQKIKEELFLYLLNKQEETQLNYAIAESNSRTIDVADGSPVPVSPQPTLILGIALIVGVAIPFGLFFLIGMLDTTIHGRRDIENYLSAPFLGDIPYHEGASQDGIAVRETGRDALSEAFRILRSNMSFMSVSAEKEMKTLLFTSSNPHAGKTFIAMNLAMTLAMAGKRVLLIDLDLRRHALSTLMGHGKDKKGITGYLSGSIADFRELIAKTNFHENFDMIYAGVQPPNPTEMLLSEKLDKLIAKLRETYDYVFLDSTPSMSVADAVISDRLADLCIYVIRDGVLDRRQLPDIERLYQERKLHNMCIVLNGARIRRHG